MKKSGVDQVLFRLEARGCERLRECVREISTEWVRRKLEEGGPEKVAKGLRETIDRFLRDARGLEAWNDIEEDGWDTWISSGVEGVVLSRPLASLGVAGLVSADVELDCEVEVRLGYIKELGAVEVGVPFDIASAIDEEGSDAPARALWKGVVCALESVDAMLRPRDVVRTLGSVQNGLEALAALARDTERRGRSGTGDVDVEEGEEVEDASIQSSEMTALAVWMMAQIPLTRFPSRLALCQRLGYDIVGRELWESCVQKLLQLSLPPSHHTALTTLKTDRMQTAANLRRDPHHTLPHALPADPALRDRWLRFHTRFLHTASPLDLRTGDIPAFRESHYLLQQAKKP